MRSSTAGCRKLPTARGRAVATSYAALRRHLAVRQFEASRHRIMPFADAAGYVTDEDVFRAIS
jgi:hypothetical protein